MHLLRVLRRSIFQPASQCRRSGDFFRQSCLLIYEHDFSSDNGPLPRTCFFPIVVHAPSSYFPPSSFTSGAGLAAAPAGHNRPPSAPAHGDTRYLPLMPAGHSDTTGAGSLSASGPDHVCPGGPCCLVPDAETGSREKQARRQALNGIAPHGLSGIWTRRADLGLPSELTV